MATKIGLPAFWASAKAASLKGCGPAADARVTAATLAAAAAKRSERRDSMGIASLVGFDGRRVIPPDDVRSHSQKPSPKSNLIDLVVDQSCVSALMSDNKPLPHH